MSDVLERRKRRPCTAGFDQVDGGSGHVTLTDLRETQARFLSSLLHRARPDRHAWKTSSRRLGVLRAVSTSHRGQL
jgi:hypothetical protein